MIYRDGARDQQKVWWLLLSYRAGGLIDHDGQGIKVGLYTPTILGGNSYISWLYDRGAKKDLAHTESSKGQS